MGGFSIAMLNYQRVSWDNPIRNPEKQEVSMMIDGIPKEFPNAGTDWWFGTINQLYGGY